MRKPRQLLAVAALLLAGCASTPASKPAPHRAAAPSGEKAQIERRLKEIFDAAEKKDMDRLDSYHFYGPHFTKFSGATPARQDAAVARAGEHEGLGSIDGLLMQAENLKIEVFGTVAVATFILDCSFMAGAHGVDKKEQATMILVRDGGARDGQWKIVHEHFSAFKATP